MRTQTLEKTILFGLLLSFLTSVIGISFAYFTSSNLFAGTGSEVKVTTSKLLNVKYDAGSEKLSLLNAYPGMSDTKTFSVTVTPGDTSTVTYAISLDITQNNFVKCSSSNYNTLTNVCNLDAEELVYILKDSNGSILATGDLLEDTGSIILFKDTKTVEAKTTYNYELKITFNDTNADQNHNFNKSLVANLKVNFVE